MSNVDWSNITQDNRQYQRLIEGVEIDKSILDNPIKLEQWAKENAYSVYEIMELPEVLKSAKSFGFDSMKIREGTDRHLVVFDKSQVIQSSLPSEQAIKPAEGTAGGVETINPMLTQEARKYKSAEVGQYAENTADLLYHGTGEKSAQDILRSGFKTGAELQKGEKTGLISLGTKERATHYSRGEKVGTQLSIPIKGLNLLEVKAGELYPNNLAKYTKLMNEKGYDGIRVIDDVYTGSGKTAEVLLKKEVATSQLIDFYNQVQSSLPSEQGTITAPEQGGGITVYHGSPEKGLTEIKPARSDYGYGINVALDIKTAKEYSKGRKNIRAFVLGDTNVEPVEGTVYKVNVQPKNSLIIKTDADFTKYELLAIEAGFEKGDRGGIGAWAKKQGYDSVIDYTNNEGLIFTDKPVSIQSSLPSEQAAKPAVGTAGGVETGRGGSQLGQGAYFSTSKSQAESYAAGKGAIGLGKEKGGGIVIERTIDPSAKIFSVDETLNPELFNKLMQSPKFAKIWKENWDIKNPTNKDLWDASNEARGVNLQDVLKQEGYQGAWHKNYITKDQPQGSRDYAIWDNSILTDNPNGIKIYRGQSSLPSEQATITAPERIIPPEINLDIVRQKIESQLPTIKKIRKEEVEPAIKKLRSEQISKSNELYEIAISQGKSVSEAIKISKRGLKGEADVPTITPLNLKNAEWETISKKIPEVYNDKIPNATYHRINAQGVLDKLRTGTVPQPAEFKYIDDLLGRKTALKVYEKYEPEMPVSEKKWQLIKSLITLTKVPFAYDVQFGRQASSLSLKHPVKYIKGEVIALKSYLNGKFSDKIEVETMNDPYHQDARAHKVRFVSTAPWEAESLRLEQFTSRTGAKTLSKLGRESGAIVKGITAPVRAAARTYLASERSAATSINWFLQDLWSSQIKSWESQGIKSERLNKYKTNYARTINAFIKRTGAESPTGKKIQDVATFILFSPSMTISRPAQLKAMIANKGSRGFAASATALNIGKIFAISAITNIVGQELASKYEKFRNADGSPKIHSDLNPLSVDWGKIVAGKSHYDLGGGDTQFYRAVAQVITQKTKTQSGEIKKASPVDTIESFLTRRENPLWQTGKELITGRDFIGKPITDDISGYIAQKIMPTFMNAVYDEAVNNGWAQAIPRGTAEFLSAGTTAYPESVYTELNKFQNKLAQDAYGVDWQDLSFEQNRELSKNEQLKELKQQKKFETKSAYQIPQKQIDIGLKIQKGLSSNTQKLLEKYKVKIGQVPKTLGDWELNDKRYEQYQKLIGEEIESGIKTISSEQWKTYNNSTKAIYLEKIIQEARARAIVQLKKESNKQ